MKFKDEKDMELFYKLHPVLQLIFMDMNFYSFVNFGKQLVITDTISTLEEDKKLGRKSLSHREFRALDISTNNLTDIEASEIRDYINYKPDYKEYHYLSNAGMYRLAFIHDSGNGEHFHVAIHSKYKWNDSLKKFDN